MARKIEKPTIIESAGNKPKVIKEFFGRVNTNDNNVSIAVMKSPGGWIEPGQTPAFDEYTVVLKGVLHVKTDTEEFDIHAGESVIVSKNEWVQYSTPDHEGAEYVAVCLPAFSPETVHRDK
ncbi:MAG: cupin domain-containing protein [Melioribacteraceae bacterium]|nr:cupin domain-containing protein [Melioribacteraceae bacterium]MCF8395506.1 cupin domain-containing protein [Melioribacteraceae bacterium]MCF8420846.1 cupin domain-containing protein [Melioribacteraceae bacterium]